jgi:hypothetical protein
MTAIAHSAILDQRVLSGFVVSDFLTNDTNVVAPNVYIRWAGATWVTDVFFC